MLGRVSQGKEPFGDRHDFLQSLVRIFGIDHAADHLDQRVHPRVLLQAPDDAPRQVVPDAGWLLGVKEKVRHRNKALPISRMISPQRLQPLQLRQRLFRGQRFKVEIRQRRNCRVNLLTEQRQLRPGFRPRG